MTTGAVHLHTRGTRGAARAAGLLVAGVLLVVSAFQFFWAFGGTWGAAEALGLEDFEPTLALQVGSGIIGALLVGAALVVLGRIGVWGERLPGWIFRWGAWAVAAALFLVALQNLTADTSWERFAWGPIALVLGLLTILVARSPRPSTRRARGS